MDNFDDMDLGYDEKDAEIFQRELWTAKLLLDGKLRKALKTRLDKRKSL